MRPETRKRRARLVAVAKLRVGYFPITIYHSLFTIEPRSGSVLVGTAGILLEIGTSHRNSLLTRAHLSRRDLVWDAVGIVIGISLTDLFLSGSRSAAAEKPR